MMASTQSVVPPLPLADVLAMPGCAGSDTIISGVQLDSRRVGRGDLFLAMSGEIHDGRQFIEQAVANGAAAIAAEAPVEGFVDGIAVPMVEIPELLQEAGYIASRFYRRPSQKLHMMGITGTNGKTTTSRIIAQLVRLLGRRCGVIGTLGATLEETISQGGNTTPDPLLLQRQLAQWCQQDVYAVSMEVSSHALVQGRVNGVAFETAVYTNLSHDHLDYHGSMDAYGRAKLRLFAQEGLRHAVVNLDDDYAPQVLAAVGEDVQALSYSTQGAQADVRVEDIQFFAGGVRAKLCSPWGEGEFTSPLPGDFNLANLAAGISALALAGEDLSAILAVVDQLQPVPGRMQSIDNKAGVQIIVDYAHTPDALEQVLQALKDHVTGSLVTVFGCGGDRDREKRQVMGRVACSLSDRVVVTSDNPRSENPAAILKDIESGCSGVYTLVEDRAQAIAQAINEAEPGDCIVIAGKGHEDYQIVEGERLYFSDEACAKEALLQRATA